MAFAIANACRFFAFVTEQRVGMVTLATPPTLLLFLCVVGLQRHVFQNPNRGM